MPQFPPESATSSALRVKANEESTPESRAEQEAEHDHEQEQWSRSEQLVAAVRDELHFLRHAYSSMHSKSKLKWKPNPLPRPGVKPERKKQKLNANQADVLWHHLQQQVDT